jgi:hypothetical protein
MKQCYKCKKSKNFYEFYLDNSSKDKLTSACKMCFLKYKNIYRATKHGFLTKALNSAKTRAKNKNINFNLDFEYLKDIATDTCPIFFVDLIYKSTTRGSGNADKNTAALDRIIPDLGYIKGNVVFISHWANTIKSNATEKELYAVADWLHEARKKALNVKENTAASIPTGDHPEGNFDTKYGALFTAGFGQDHHYSYYHSGAVQGQDIDHRAQESSGDSVAHRNRKVEPSRELKSREDNGDSIPEVGGPELGGRRLFD